jgi:hypothetical protein
MIPLSWKELIQNRLDHFWGYGNLDGAYWFVGMEEGHDLDIESLRGRFTDTWDKSVVDIYEGMPSFITKLAWFKGTKTKIQRTYRGFIMIKLYLDLGRLPTTDEVREYQKTKLGRTVIDGKPSDHAMLELMPLPATSIKEKHWLYKDFDIPEIATRKAYLEKYRPEQCRKLRALIQQHSPKLVVFYSLLYLPDWQSVVPGELEEVTDRQYIYRDKNTLYCVLPHPVAHGISNADWERWGSEIRRRL